MNWTSKIAKELSIILKKNRTYTSVIGVMIIILIFGIVNSGYLGKIPLLQKMSSADNNINLERYDDYLEVVGKSKEYKNVKVTLESAVADNNILMLSFFVINSNEENIELKDADIHISSLNINGKEMYLISKNSLELIGNNEAKIVKRIVWNYENLPENLNISVGIDKMFNIDGNWDIRFNVDTDKILKDTYVEKINTSINLNNIKGTIKEVTISPLTVKIDATFKSKNNSELGFLVLNEDDEQLMLVGENISTNFKQYEYTAKYLTNKPLEKLKVIPLYYGSEKKEEPLIWNTINLDEFHQFYLNVDDKLAIKIIDCIYDERYFVIKYYYEYLGKPIKANLNKLYLKCNNVICNEEDNEEIKKIKAKYHGEDYKLAVFQSDCLENLEIGCYNGTNNRLLYDYSFEIEK